MNYKEEMLLLVHSGILGMKWGVRRNRTKESSSFSTNSATKSSDPKTASTKVHVSQLTDKELSDRIKRIQLESMYSQLTMSKIDKGLKVISGMLGNSAKQIAQQMLTDNLKTLAATLIPKTPADIPAAITKANETT